MVLNLPDNISGIILHNVLAKDVASLDEWKQQLPYLAVCSKWRLLALPIAYHSLVIECRCAGIQSAEHSASDQDPAWATQASNISLITILRYTPLATRLVLHMDYPMGIVHYLEKTIALLQLHSVQWPFVTHIQARLKSNMDSKYKSWIGATECKLAALTTSLVCTLPNITSLCPKFDYTDDTGRSTQRNLIIGYLHQIVHLDCSVDDTFRISHFTRHLRHLDIKSTENKVSLARINMDNLEYLHLNDMVNECQKNTFYTCNNSRKNTFVFENLRILVLDHSSELKIFKNSDLYSRIYFPSLQKLQLDMDHIYSRILTLAHYPTILPLLEITNHKNGIIRLYNTKFGTAERSMVSQNTVSNDGLHFAALATQLLQTKEMCTRMHITVFAKVTQFIPHLFNLQNLQYLTLEAVEMPKLIEIITSTGSLKQLTVTNINGDNDLDSIDCDLCYFAISSINDSIEKVQIMSINGETERLISILFEQVVIRLPALMQLDVPKSSQSYDRFIVEYICIAPHLQMLNISQKY